MLYHLADNGRIGLVLANGSLSSQQGTEGDIRKNIVNADLVGIIAMPSQLFYNVKFLVVSWFSWQRRKRNRADTFVDARNMGYMKDRTHRELSCGEETEDHGDDIALQTLSNSSVPGHLKQKELPPPLPLLRMKAGLRYYSRSLCWHCWGGRWRRTIPRKGRGPPRWTFGTVRPVAYAWRRNP